jgi:hypothetical protein
MGILNVIQKNEQIDIVDDVEISLPWCIGLK